MGLDEDVLGVERLEGIGDVGALAVGPMVVSHDPFDTADPESGEVDRGPEEEASAGLALLVGQDFGVGQPGVVMTIEWT